MIWGCPMGQGIPPPILWLEIEIWQQLLCHRDKWISPQMRAAMEYLQEL